MNLPVCVSVDLLLDVLVVILRVAGMDHILGVVVDLRSIAEQASCLQR